MSVRFGAYDGYPFLRLNPQNGRLGQYDPYYQNQYQNQYPQEEGGAPVAAIIIGAILLSQLFAFCARGLAADMEERGLKRATIWGWYDWVLLPSYIIYGLFSIFG